MSAPGLAELHRHIDGSLRPETLVELARAQGQPLEAVPRFHPGMGLVAALSCFETTLRVMQGPDQVARVAAECCEDAAAEGITTLELRFAPQLHRGADPEDIVDAALEGIAGRAGLVLCGLYGEDPRVLWSHVTLARSRPGVVGIDLAGGPAPGHRFSMADHAPAFRAARAIGLGRTVHAGEGRPAQEIIDAIELLGAQRIGHGLSLLDDPAALALVRDRGVTIEACPTSNWHVGALSDPGAHPLPRWLEAGVNVALCCDNTLLSDVRLDDELARFPDHRAQLTAMAHAAAFPRRAGTAPAAGA